MLVYLKKLILLLCLFWVAGFASAEKIRAGETDQKDIANLRKLFEAATENEFELVRDEVKGNDSSHTGGRYWLAHVKPKQSGFYFLKYTYKNINSVNNYPEEGEHQLNINVGGKICYRRNDLNSGISSYCLGDTIIVPVRLDGVAQHSFSLESKKQNGESLEESQKRQKSFLKFSSVEQVNNPLAANLKLLGTQSFSSPYRACCKERITHYAYFEAVSAGRFNLSLSSSRTGENFEDLSELGKISMPIIVVNPGTSITALVPSEKTINYADDKKFSAHAGNSFITNVLILQPGDVFAVQYSEYTITSKIGDKTSAKKDAPDIKPVIYKLPFAVDRKWSFNEWIADYLPRGK